MRSISKVQVGPQVAEESLASVLSKRKVRAACSDRSVKRLIHFFVSISGRYIASYLDLRCSEWISETLETGIDQGGGKDIIHVQVLLRAK